MAETLKTLRRRVRSIKSMQQVTRAMEMVSASKLRRATITLEAARPYATKLQELLARLTKIIETCDAARFSSALVADVNTQQLFSETKEVLSRL